MSENEFENRLREIEKETAEIKRLSMQLEFQYRKDRAESQKDFDERDRCIQERLDYIAKLAGITYDELDKLDVKTQEAGRMLNQPREHSSLV